MSIAPNSKSNPTPVARTEPASVPAPAPASSPAEPAPIKTPPTAAGSESVTEAAKAKVPFFKGPLVKKALPVVALIVLAALAHWVYGMWTHEETDDAFITADVHTISSRVQGAVVQVLVNDNQKVKKGDVLVVLDPREYEAAVKMAQAKYSKAHRDLGRMVGAHRGDGDDEDSGEFLPDERPVYDQYRSDALSSEGELQTAILHWQFTKILAPTDGVIGKKSVESGQLVQPGQALMALVENDPWIVANFKESQLTNIRIGQEVDITVDAISGHVFKGKVESVAPGSGATFSLLPPDNATGNFTKVVQRIPVKVVFDKESVKGYEDRLVPGLSTEVEIRVR